jgi:hypothetical protein
MAQELEEYRRRSDETGEFIYFCPDCKNGEGGPLEFDTVHKFKTHMQREHGGILDSELAATVGASTDGAETVATSRTAVATAPRPKRLSAKSRELNDKLNEAVKLCVKHLLQGIDESERAHLTELTNDVTMGWIGVEIDFEEKLFSISGRMASIILVIALNVVPRMPSLKEMIATAKQKQEETATVEEPKELRIQ